METNTASTDTATTTEFHCQNPLFKDLTAAEVEEYRQWARDNYIPLSDIKGVWHPVVQKECCRINETGGGDQMEPIIGAPSAPADYPGMTLHEWYVGMALQGILANPNNTKLSCTEIVEYAHLVAATAGKDA